MNSYSLGFTPNPLTLTLVTHSNSSSGPYMWYIRPEPYPCGTWLVSPLNKMVHTHAYCSYTS